MRTNRVLRSGAANSKVYITRQEMGRLWEEAQREQERREIARKRNPRARIATNAIPPQ